MTGDSTGARRRDFLRSLVRYGLLGVLGLVAGRLVTGSGPARPEAACTGRGACRRCRRLGRCGLPQAALASLAAEQGWRLP